MKILGIINRKWTLPWTAAALLAAAPAPAQEAPGEAEAEAPGGTREAAGEAEAEAASGAREAAGEVAAGAGNAAGEVDGGDGNASREAAGQPEAPGAGAEEELAPITLEDSRHVADPVFTDEVPENIEEPPPPPETDHERLMRLFTLYKDAIAEGSYDEADALAKRIVELTIELNGRDSEESARALTNLAIAQHGQGDYEAAQLNFKTSIEIIERVKNRLAGALINPLKGLGASQLASGHPELATETFQRAVHISHVNNGPHNMMQVELLESLAETYLTAGELDESIDLYERIFGLQARDVDMDSEEILPALRNRAHWQHRLELYDKERYTWRRIINILEDHRGKDDLSLIPPLTGLGQSYLYIAPPDLAYAHPTSNSTGEIYLKRALRIAEDNPESDWRIQSDALLKLGDYYILTDKPSRAERTYREAWEIMSGDEERLESRRDKLQSMQVLQGIRPPKFYGIESSAAPTQRPEGFETGTIVYRYSLSTRGKPTDIELIELQPAGLEDMDAAVSRELRRLVQRPRMVDGETVSTERLTYTHDFYYRNSDLPEPVEENESLADAG